MVTESRPINVTVAYFASARECAGMVEEQLELPEAMTVQQVFSKVLSIHPKLAEMKRALHILVNGKWASEETEIAEGDRVAVIPPVGGG